MISFAVASQELQGPGTRGPRSLVERTSAPVRRGPAAEGSESIDRGTEEKLSE
ncbi:hypothetical protein H920_14818 [Fukomys damarensis]|uniref:Uncharacterized protein n=1 Tax=Fukomys damarensis TaxID=885580 RepID=A0A091CVG1_FUKDA|nr:hypothetical protein H920_14818 [Fukomys damarensis]